MPGIWVLEFMKVEFLQKIGWVLNFFEFFSGWVLKKCWKNKPAIEASGVPRSIKMASLVQTHWSQLGRSRKNWIKIDEQFWRHAGYEQVWPTCGELPGSTMASTAATSWPQTASASDPIAPCRDDPDIRRLGSRLFKNRSQFVAAVLLFSLVFLDSQCCQGLKIQPTQFWAPNDILPTSPKSAIFSGGMGVKRPFLLPIFFGL